MMDAVAETNPGMLFSGIDVVDVDTHYSEPADLWTSRAPARWKDRVPQVKKIAGKRVWCIDGGSPSSRVGDPQAAGAGRGRSRRLASDRAASRARPCPGTGRAHSPLTG